MFVRSKDYVYDTSKGLYTPSIKMYAIGTKTIYEADIIKQSDTIEELCDMYVYVEADKLPCVAGLKINTKQYKLYRDFCLVNHIGLYGAIWTDKGLIYVAKMNEKGELELI